MMYCTSCKSKSDKCINLDRQIHFGIPTNPLIKVQAYKISLNNRHFENGTFN